ncbi:MAG: acyltransferase family protein [Clostridiales bacterium]|nr:acyltransferase family protein [Clostridiales bacterium]
MDQKPPVPVLKIPPRSLTLNALRALAAFLVIVNHTNSALFKASNPSDVTWWFSMAWYYLSKIAVPLFVMISGALLLPRRDSYARTVGRALRVLGALLLFSYFYYLWNLWQFHWTWEQALNLPAFLASFWQKPITDSFWYLYFYLGLMAMLPLLQRLAAAMDKRDLCYLTGCSFLFGSLWPLLTHYVPEMRLPAYLQMPLFWVFLGLFFAGHYLHSYARPSRGKGWFCLIAIVASVGLSLLLTRLEYTRLNGMGKYWFMDERTVPSITIIVCAMAVMFLPRCWAKEERNTRPASPQPFWARLLSSLGACAFGVYLLQDWVIAQTKGRIFEPLLGFLHPIPAVLLWEILVYGVAIGIAWVLSILPGLKKLL